MMNILIFYHDDMRKISGTPLYIVKIAKELAKKHKVHLVFKHKKISEDEEKQFYRFEYGKNISVHNLFSNDLSLLSPFFFRRFNKLLKKIKPDFIYSYSNLWALPMLLLARKNKIPLIYEAHGLWYEHSKQKMPWIVLFNHPLAFLDKWIISKYDGLNTVSPKLSEYYKKNKNCLVTFPCVETEVIKRISKSKNTNKTKKVIVTYSGNFNKYQGIDLFLNAIKVLKERGMLDKFLFQFIGNIDDDILGVAKKEGFTESIVLRGKRKPFELEKFYAMTDIFIVPRRDSLNVRYSCAGKLLEYMAMGKTVVATNVGAAPYLIEHKKDGFLVNPNKKEIADALISLQDEKVRHHLGENATIKILKNHTLVDARKNIEELFRNVKGNVKGSSKNMKIVIYYPENLAKLSGTPFRILRMAEFLAKAGHEVTVVCTNMRSEDCKGFSFSPLPLKNKLRYINTRAVRKIIKDIQPDLWYSFTEASLPSAVNPCKKYNITHIIELHDHYLYESFFKSGFKAKESSLLFNVLNNKVINYLAKADCIIVLTDALKEYYLPKVKRIEFMFPGADKRLFDPKVKPLKELQELKKKFTILTYAGNFNKYQGADLLFDVIKELKVRKVRGFKFLLMGGDLSKYKEMINKEGLQELIHFVGKPPLKDTSLYLTATDFFIVPKVDWHGSKYLFASKYCDYVMFHKPIISTNIGEAALKLVKENGMLVSPTKEDLVNAILKIKDKKWCDKVTKAAIKMNTAPFTIEDNIKQFEKIIKEIKNNEK